MRLDDDSRAGLGAGAGANTGQWVVAKRCRLAAAGWGIFGLVVHGPFLTKGPNRQPRNQPLQLRAQISSSAPGYASTYVPWVPTSIFEVQQPHCKGMKEAAPACFQADSACRPKKCWKGDSLPAACSTLLHIHGFSPSLPLDLDPLVWDSSLFPTLRYQNS